MKQLDAVTKSTASTNIERIIAHDELGLAQLYSKDAKAALGEFTSAITLAEKDLQSTDPEWAYLYLHRSLAEEQTADTAASQKDRAEAKSSLDVLVSSSVGPNQTYYRNIEQQFLAGGS